MSVAIRPMESSDWDAVAKIYQEGMDTNLATFQTDCPPYEDWNASHMKCCRLVAVDADGAVIGWAALPPVSSRCVYAGVAEISVYISSTQRGKGVGSALQDALAAASEKEGVWTLQSGIMADNTASIRLHEKAGYRVIGYREKIEYDHNGTWHDTVLMERRSKVAGTSKQ